MSLLKKNVMTSQKVSKNKVKQKHGYGGTRIHNIWKAMVYRCSAESYKYYNTYGGRGITVCERWKTFTNFLEDMSPSYSDELELDRIDNNKGYCKENCRFVPRIVNASNKRNNRFIEYNGESKTLSQWSRDLGISKNCLFRRLKMDWSIKDAFETPSLKGTGRPKSRKIKSSTEARLKRSKTRQGSSSSSQVDAAEKHS
jgi:hypothetical protein